MSPTKQLLDAFSGGTDGFLPMDRLFDGVNDIVFFVKDAQGRYLSVNDTLAKRCGLPNKDAVLGLTADQLFPTALGKAFTLQDREILRNGHPIRNHLELHLYTGGRSGWCLTFKEPIRGKNGEIIGICGISRDLNMHGEPSENLEALSGVLEFIHHHYGDHLRLPMLAKMAGLSIYQFDHRIRGLFHLTAGQYLTKVRIDAACQRLFITNEAIAQIALSCGYSDQSAFSRQFKQATGISPLAYRKKMKIE